MSLRLASNFTLPTDLVVDSFAVLGRRGSGKSHTASVLAEEMLELGCQIVVLDPTNAWYGLKSSADGSKPAYPVIVFGSGKYSDVVLEPDYGNMLADFVVDSGRSVVLSMRHFTPDEMCQFVADFAGRLYLRKADDSSPVHLFCDECDRYAPQNYGKLSKLSLASIDACVRMGRSSGIGVTLISQRSAVVNKDVLTQTAVMVCHQTTGPHDKDAVERWVKHHDPDGELKFVETLPKLKTGEAWFSMVGDHSFLKKVQVRARRTYDSSQTPRVGVKRVAPKALAQVDLNELDERLKQAVAEQRASDPEALKAEVKRLREEIKKLEARRAGLTEEEKQRLRSALLDSQESRLVIKQVTDLVDSLRVKVTRVGQLITGLALEPPAKSAPVVAERRTGMAPIPVPFVPTDADAGAGIKLDRCPLSILTAVVQYGPIGIEEASVIAGYAYNSTVRSATSRLRSAGLIAGANAKMAATDAGRARVAGASKLVTGAALAEIWFGKVDACPREILKVVIGSYPGMVSIQDACKEAGYAYNSTVRAATSKLRSLRLVIGPNAAMRAHPRLVQ